MNTYAQPLLMYYFGTTQTEHRLSRRYQKLQEALANVAGISNSLIFIGFILTGFQSNLSMVTKIIKNLYISQHKSKKHRRKRISIDEKKGEYKMHPSKIDFSGESPEKRATVLHPHSIDLSISSLAKVESPEKKARVLRPNSIDLSVSSPVKKDTSPFVESPQKKKDVIVEMTETGGVVMDTANNMFTERADVMKDSQAMINKADNVKTAKFEKYINKSIKVRGLKITTYNYMKAQIKKTFGKSLNDEQLLILKAMDIYNKEIDIITIMTKLQEIEKLKKILLSDDEIAMFELIDKPRIYGEEDEVVRSDMKNETKLSMFSPKGKKEETMQKTLQIYNHLVEKTEKSIVELRLLDMLEEDIDEYDQN